MEKLLWSTFLTVCLTSNAFYVHVLGNIFFSYTHTRVSRFIECLVCVDLVDVCSRVSYHVRGAEKTDLLALEDPFLFYFSAYLP